MQSSEHLWKWTKMLPLFYWVNVMSIPIEIESLLVGICSLVLLQWMASYPCSQNPKFWFPIFSLHDFGLCSPIPQNDTPEMATTLNLTCAWAFGKTHNSVPEYFKHVCLGRLQPIFKGTEQRLHRLHVCGHCCVVDLHCGKTTFHHTENVPNKESPCKPQQ